MEQLNGVVFSGIVIDENDRSYIIQKNGISFRLNKEEGSYSLGEVVEGFAYYNQKQQACFTTKIPAVCHQFQFCEVTGTRKDLGAFVDIGLPDKDLVVSMDGLPDMRSLWPKKGDWLMVRLIVDEKGRMWGELAEDSYFQAIAQKAPESVHNQAVEGIVYHVKMVGTYIITKEHYLGFIHPSERTQEPRLGETLHARVIGVRTDGLVNLSLKPRSYEVINDDAAMILTFLEKSPDGMIPFSDRSTPEEIQAKFAISKGQFKRALGHLMKEKKIKQENGKTYLLEKEDSN